MGIILLVLLLALILGGLGFAIHVLWWIALIVLVDLADRVRRAGRRGRIPGSLVPLVTGRPPLAGGSFRLA